MFHSLKSVVCLFSVAEILLQDVSRTVLPCPKSVLMALFLSSGGRYSFSGKGVALRSTKSATKYLLLSIKQNYTCILSVLTSYVYL